MLRPTGSRVQAYLWVLCLIVGFSMGSIAFLLDILVEEIVTLRWEATEKIAKE